MTDTAITGSTSSATAELRRSFTYRTAAAAAGVLSTFLLTVVAVRALPPAEAAVLLAILAALSIGPLLGRLGLGPNVIRTLPAEAEPARRRELASVHLRATGLLSVLSAPVVAVVATIGLLPPTGQYLPVVALTIALIVVESVRLTLSDIFAAVGRVRASVSTTHHVRSFLALPLVCLAVLVSERPTLIGIVAVYCGVAFVQVAVAMLAARRDVTLLGSRSLAGLRGVIRSGALLVTFDLAAFLVLPGTIWLASAVFPPMTAAQYSTAAALAQQVTVLESLAALAVMPAASRLWAMGRVVPARTPARRRAGLRQWFPGLSSEPAAAGRRTLGGTNGRGAGFRLHGGVTAQIAALPPDHHGSVVGAAVRPQAGSQQTAPAKHGRAIRQTARPRSPLPRAVPHLVSGQVHESTSRVLVIGGGISGLATAYRLTRAGAAVTLLEAGSQLGGLGTFFDDDGAAIERFYHCVMPTDEHLLPLLKELGLSEAIRWRSTKMGMVVQGRRYPFNSALDLLRFTPLTLPQRIRFGAVSVALRRLGRGKDLDNLRIEDWLRGLYGEVAWKRIFQPMFGSKFGSSFGDVPALYLWQRLGRKRNVATRGYPEGGYKSIITALREGIEAGGGQVRTSVPVHRLTVTEDGATAEFGRGETIAADWAVSTVPLSALHAIADDALAFRLPETRLPYQGVVNALFFLRRPLDGHYWAPVVHSGTDFDGVIEMSALTGTERYRGRHLVYAMRYTDRSSELFNEDAGSIGGRWSEQLLRLYPDLDPDDIDAVRVFKAPFVEPVYPLGYGSRVPAMEVDGTRLLLATTAQIYPNVTSWNSSVGLSKRVVDHLLARTAVSTG
jgi:protoporphyrinogen oxidase